MSNEIKKNLAIDYTARDFNSIRSRLVDHAKKYYPETFKDFSEGSFGSMLVDMISYIGDQMSLYLDYSVNETFLTTANEYENVVKIGHQMGYKFDPTPAASGVVTLYLALPVDSTGQVPDLRYAPIIRSGTTFRGDSGATFTLTGDVDFGNAGITEYIVIEEDPQTGAPTLFGAQAFGIAVSGKINTQTFSVGAHTPFLSLELENENVSEIISVTDSEGRPYYEVDYLTQNMVYKQVSNGRTRDRDTVPMILRPVVVPRRFIVERNGTVSNLRFGYGSEFETEAESVLNPSDVVLKRHARNYISELSFDPYKMLKSDKLGIAPENTVVNVAYRTNGRSVVNVAAGSIRTLQGLEIKFDLTDNNLDPLVMSRVSSSVEVDNQEPFSGSSEYPGIYELKHRIMSSYSSQNRAVTLDDYKSVIYNMPKRFGAVSRCFVERDQDSFKNNINVHILTESEDGSLAIANESCKNNLKTWLSRYKTVMDTVDILDGKIVNIGVDFLVKVEEGKQESLIIKECVESIASEIGSYKLQMGQTFYRSNLFKALSRVPYVSSVIDVRIYQKFGQGYSDVFYDFESRKLPDGTGYIAQKDVCFELKYPDIDLRGAVER